MSAEAAQLSLRVASIEAITPRIRLLELVAAEGGELPRFEAGAHIDIDIPQVDGRSYSLLNSPAERHRYRIAVLRELVGRGGSAWMHDKVKVGDVLSAAPPSNNFPLSKVAESHLLIAGGIGITPMMSMIAQLEAEGAQFSLHYCAQSPTQAAFIDELRDRLGERLNLYFDGGDPANGLGIAALLKSKPPGGHAYVCGPRGMIQAVREATGHWPNGTVHWELFGGDEADTAPRVSDTAFEIELAKSGQVLNVPANRKIIDVLRDAGIKVKTLCKDGVCGTCKTRVLSGAVEHRDEVLTKKEQANFMQVCVSRAKAGETRLILDL